VVQFNILSGKTAGTEWSTRRFPVRIGRAASSDLRLEEDGVWNDHLLLECDPAEGFILEAFPNTSAIVNGHAVQGAVLRNGDLIEIGSVKMQFSLSKTRQKTLLLRETLTWVAVGALCLGQVLLVYWLLA
jgi:pSer/pThr/pTyr-binding forkhead associated (FHA) protein